MKPRKKIDQPGRFLEENGILFEINRQVLHPLGMELSFEFDEEGDLCRIVLRDNRDSEGPIYFTPAEFLEGRDKYETYLEEHGRRNIQKRRRIGVVIQTGPTTHMSLREGEE